MLDYKDVNLINNIFNQYIQIKKAKDDIDTLYDSVKESAMAILETSRDHSMIVGNNEFKYQQCHRETTDDKGLSKWLLDNECKDLLNVVYKPNMELINGVYSSRIPQDIRSKYIKDTAYNKIVVKQVEES